MRLETLILIRLATIKEQSPSELQRSLRRLVPAADLKKVLDERVAVLAAGGWIKTRPLRITDAGRARVAKELGVSPLPTWARFKSRFIPTLMLGMPVEDADDLRAGVIADLLVKQLPSPPRATKPREQLKVVLGKLINEMRIDADSLQAALVKRWLADERVVEAPPPPKPWSDADVIAAVRDATPQVPPAGRLGSDRVFVSAIWRQLGEGAAFPGLTLDGFKSRLVAANRAQQLTLARADLGTNVNPQDVLASEIRVLNSTFHFVVDSSRP